VRNSRVHRFAACLAIGASLAAGCGKPAVATKPAPADRSASRAYIAIISKGWQHQFWQAVKLGADRAAKDLDVRITFEGPEGDSAVSKQIQMIETALAKGPAALVIAACDSKAVIPALAKAEAAGIPVIGFDSGVESEIPLTTVATDNFAAAGAAADRLARAIGGRGEVAIICHDLPAVNLSITGKDRRDGFAARMKEKYPEIRIADIQYGGGDHLASESIAKKYFRDFPGLKGIFATNEGSTVGLINGVLGAKKGGTIAIVGFDSSKLMKDAVRTGVMLGAISQDPVMIGYKAVKAAYEASKGKKLPADIDTGYKWYDASNVDSEEMKPLLYD
jgi:ribose transport system substrate-binding protein